MYRIFYNNRCISLLADTEATTSLPHGSIYIPKKDENLALIALAFESRTDLNCLNVIVSDLEEAFHSFSLAFEFIDAAGGVISNEKGEYLLIYRHNLWDLPKGKREDGEEPPYTARREVMEECGLESIEVGTLNTITYHCYRYQGRLTLKRTFWYNMQASSTSPLHPQQEEQITDVRWIPQSSLSQKLADSYASIKSIFSL